MTDGRDLTPPPVRGSGSLFSARLRRWGRMAGGPAGFGGYTRRMYLYALICELPYPLWRRSTTLKRFAGKPLNGRTGTPCDVCGAPAKSQHSEPSGDTFWLCAGCEDECAEVARDGQYVTPDEVSRGL